MKKILTGIADIIFPPRCIACGVLLARHDPLPFCPACLAGIHFIRSPLCTRCGAPFPSSETEDHPCGDCLATEKPFAIARSVGRYEETLLTAIHRFKYNQQYGLGRVLGKIMVDFTREIWDMTAFDLIIPVPLHIKRLRERGFNQALILGKEISKRCGVPLDFTSLRRSVNTMPQVSLSRKERSQNVHDAFTVVHPERISGKRLLLLDDVYTTGSTLTECARVLIRAKADAVAVLTLARAVFKPGVDRTDEKNSIME